MTEKKSLLVEQRGVSYWAWNSHKCPGTTIELKLKEQRSNNNYLQI